MPYSDRLHRHCCEAAREGRPALYDRLNLIAEKGEARFGRWGWVILLAFILMLAASLYVRPGTNYVGHGVNFEALSRNPLDLRHGNILGYRIMTPLVAYLIGLRGKPFILLNLFFAGVTIGTVYRYFRASVVRAGDALFGALCITFSTVVLVTIYYAGFCDALTYLAIFLAWRWWSRPALFYPVFLIGILNHEGVLFTLPWFAYLKMIESPRKSVGLLEMLIGFGVTMAAYAVFRSWLSGAQDVGLSMTAYLRPIFNDPLAIIKHAYQYYWLGLFTVFKALWIFPVAAAIAMWKDRQKSQVIGMVLLMLCAASQLFLAYDTTRMLTLGFMVLIISLEYLFRTNAYGFRQWAPWVFLFNFFVPQLFTAATIIEIMHSTPSNLLRMIMEHGPWWV